MKTLSKAQLDRVLAQVTDDVAELLKSEADEGVKLSKADEGEETPAEKKPEGSSTEPPAPEASPEASADAPPAGDESAPAPEASAEGSPEGDPAADAGLTPEALQAEYAKLPPEELKMHFLAAKAALMAVMGSDDGQAPPEASAPPAAPPAAAGPEGSAVAPEASTPPMGKKELKMGDGSGGKITPGKMAKSEDVVIPAEILERLTKAEAALSQVEDLKKSLADKDAQISQFEEKMGQVAAGFQKLMNRPMRKSVTGISYIQKPGSESGADVSRLSKTEVVQKLTEVTASSTLTKSDRDLINSYVVGNVPVDAVAKFLK